MKTMAYWAAAHPLQARWSIAGLQVSLGLLAITQGYLLWQMDWLLSPAIIYTAVSALAFAIFVYPFADSPRLAWWSHFGRRKTGDFLLAAVAYIMVLQLSIAGYDYLSRPVEVTGQAEFMVHSRTSTIKKGFVYKLKALKNTIREHLADERTPVSFWQILLLLLSIVVAFYLLYIVAALSCSISCNGSTALATVVLVLGSAAVIFLLILGIKAIFKKQRMARRARLGKS